MSTNKSIAKSAGIIGFATFCSRILGFCRDVVIARLFGVYLYAQAFVIAFRIPNLFRDLVAEGAANAAVVPVLSEYSAKHSKEAFWEAANVILNLLLVIAMSITILGMVFSPFLVRIIAPGFAIDPQKLATTIALNRIIFPYILLISLAAYCMAILNTLKHFSVPAFAPCLLNISIIAFALLLGEGIKGLALGVLVGGLLQLAVQIPVLYAKGFRLKLFQKFRHPVARQIGTLMLPRLLSSCIYQLNNFVDSIFGSLAIIVGEGGVAILYFSYRLVQFPLGIFSASLSQAILPALSTQALEQGHARLKQTFSFGLRATFFVMLPASVGLIVLPQFIIQSLFGGGRFDSYSIQATSRVLLFYSIGLCAYGTTRIAQACFFALKDTVTPTKVSALALALNIILNALLMFPLKISGLALATSVSGILSCLVLLRALHRRLQPFTARPIAASFLKIVCASCGMGFICYVASMYWLIPKSSLFFRAVNLGIVVSAAAVAYVAFCFLFRVNELGELWRWAREKRG